MSDESIDYKWKISLNGPPFMVLDWANRWHTFQDRDDAVAFVDRDKRMFSDASRTAHEDVTDQITYQLQHSTDGLESDDEQAVDSSSEGETPSPLVRGKGNRKSRRRAARVANRTKAIG